MLELLLLGLFTGVLIGLVGIGGVLLAPLLSYWFGHDLHLAMAISSWSFLFAGIAGTTVYARNKAISWRMVRWLCIGVVPTAVLGAWVNSKTSVDDLTILLAVLIAFSGVHAYMQAPEELKAKRDVNHKQLVAIGMAVGFGSALTGTGGPILLIPILLFLRVPALLAIGASQVIQLPISIFAAIGFAQYGRVDFELGTILGVTLAVGVLLGAQLAPRLASRQLQKIVAATLIGVSVFMLMRAI